MTSFDALLVGSAILPFLLTAITLFIDGDKKLSKVVITFLFSAIVMLSLILLGPFVKQWNLIVVSIVLAMLPIIILCLFAQKYIVVGLGEGAIK